MEGKAPAIGIDLGTTNSCVGVFRCGKVEIITNDQGDRTTPSYVAFTETVRLIGNAAKNQVSMNPENTVCGTKRLIGRRFEDSVLQSDMKHWPFRVVNDGGEPKIEVSYKGETKSFSPMGISSMVLSKLKEIAETYLGKKVSNAVITMPSYFNNYQRGVILGAGTIAGLNVFRVINESTAAAIAYGFDNEVRGSEQNVLIFDLGGSNCNVSIVTIEDGIYDVKSVAGDSHLGGEDFDNRMVDYFTEQFKTRNKKDITKRAVRRLRTACERAKRCLSTCTEATIEIDSFFEGTDFYSSITRACFEEINADLFVSILEPVEKALRDAKFDTAQIHEIVLVGGSTRIPKVQKVLQDFFNGKELNKTINPDEAVAYGAAIQAAILSGDKSEEIRNLMLLDVAALTLGIETAGGVMTAVIKRNWYIPTKHTRTFTTCFDDNQMAALILEDKLEVESGSAENFYFVNMRSGSSETQTLWLNVYEGERAMVMNNNLLAKLELKRLPVSEIGNPGLLHIDVTFDIDASRDLIVSAVEKSTGREYKVNISQGITGRISDDLGRMVKEAERFRAEDAAPKERIQSKNRLESYIFAMRQSGTIRDKCKEVLEWLDENQLAGTEEFVHKQKELEAICNPIIMEAYRAISVASGAGGIPRPHIIEEVD